MMPRTEGSVRSAGGRDAMLTSSRRIALLYLAATVTAAVALGAMALLRRLHDVDAPFLLALAPVVFVCWLGGLGPGLFTATLVTLGIDFFFISPIHSFQISSYGQGLNLSVFLL